MGFVLAKILPPEAQSFLKTLRHFLHKKMAT
ncbi:hypothetical protein C8N43_2176 [Litoreibacter ponti]|uniref:Uncharacterized protein n=1 Tax=Litoreibacter ponti TaxID=1510457 RepID=A0A2T6BN71_9RHOB|nr:hypothetical protein C8N43_2176 [Litoreibacter ponti]